ncbi:MAG: hypothetical protein HY867_16255 [Chloroflexi bacterium]|nr:hypothetical protein [Chloroflexota bacterium]
MNSKRYRVLALVSIFLLISVPCSYLQVQLTEPPPSAPSPSVLPIEAQSTFTDTVSTPALEKPPNPIMASTETFIPTRTVTHTFTPTFLPTFTFTITNTSLPPLPDFDELVTFGGGGGGGECGVPPSLPPALEVHQYNNVLVLCMWGVNFGLPFEITFNAPDGRIAGPIKLLVDQRTGKVKWQGYHQDDFLAIADWGNNGTFAEVQIWWPIDYPTGQWQAVAYGEGLQASDYFQVQKESSHPYIAALNPRPWNDITPGIIDRGLHMIQLKGNRKVNMLGLGYPLNSIVYLLTYRGNTPSSQDFILIATQAVHSDFNGSFTAELIGAFDPGQSYLIVGVCDPNAHIAGENHWLIQKHPHDYFKILSDSAPGASCPGAPPQRMIVNQRGYVCTQSDRIRLRNAPAKSASTIVYVNTGVQFTVVGGPSCSDDWSWWNVRLDDGMTGWLAEGGDAVDPYFICPLP